MSIIVINRSQNYLNLVWFFFGWHKKELNLNMYVRYITFKIKHNQTLITILRT